MRNFILTLVLAATIASAAYAGTSRCRMICIPLGGGMMSCTMTCETDDEE